MTRFHNEQRFHDDHPGPGGRRSRSPRGPWRDDPGFGAPWGGPRRGGGRMRRGDIRVALLKSLEEGPAHGYEVIRRLEERSGGLWRPSAGSVYPTLQMLEEQELLVSRDEGGKRVYELTETGRAEAQAGEEKSFPWAGGDAGGHRALFEAIGQLAMATRQVQSVGDAQLMEQALGLLKETRQKMYQLLAQA